MIVGIDGELGRYALDVPGRSHEASKAALRLSAMALSFMAVGSLVQAIHSVEGSVAPVERRPRSPHRFSELEGWPARSQTPIRLPRADVARLYDRRPRETSERNNSRS
jgi:hypothetical protein